jgi:hypothetical protein
VCNTFEHQKNWICMFNNGKKTWSALINVLSKQVVLGFFLFYSHIICMSNIMNLVPSLQICLIMTINLKNNQANQIITLLFQLFNDVTYAKSCAIREIKLSNLHVYRLDKLYHYLQLLKLRALSNLQTMFLIPHLNSLNSLTFSEPWDLIAQLVILNRFSK